MRNPARAILLSVIAASCGKKTTPPSAATITLTAQLVAAARDTSPFAGDSLSCVTFAQPPVAGSATVDASGNVSLSIAAQNTPLGCFVLDAQGNALATLVFSASGTSSSLSQTVSFSGNAALGAITVDVDNEIATVALPASGTVVDKTPAGLACPIGLWTVAGTGSCTYGGTALVSADGSGGYQTSLTIFSDDNNGGCSARSFPSTKASFDAATKKFSFSVNGKTSTQGCASAAIVATFTLSANADCTQAAVTAATSGCGSCSTDGLGCEGCGGVACPNPTGATPLATVTLQ